MSLLQQPLGAGEGEAGVEEVPGERGDQGLEQDQGVRSGESEGLPPLVPQVESQYGHQLALCVQEVQEREGGQDEPDGCVSDPQVGVHEEGRHVLEHTGQFLQPHQPQLSERGERVHCAAAHHLLVVREAHVDERREHGNAGETHEGRHRRDMLEEGGAHLPVLLVVEEGDHVREDDVVGPLLAEEEAELGEGVEQDGLPHLVV